eukprot:scaffold343748_cov24-Attheya_sp.AAC.1
MNWDRKSGPTTAANPSSLYCFACPDTSSNPQVSGVEDDRCVVNKGRNKGPPKDTPQAPSEISGPHLAPAPIERIAQTAMGRHSH